MIKRIKVSSALLIAALVTTFLEMPSQAAIQQQPQPLLTESNSTYLALSWGDVVDGLRRGSRPQGGRPGAGGVICAIAPVKLLEQGEGNTQEIQAVWNERPLFLWTIEGGTVEEIELLLEGSDEVLWNREIAEGETSIVYDGKPLKPGQSYKWRLVAPFPRAQPPFRVMEQQERDRISAELRQLEEQFKGDSAETLALEKANYFVEQKLWSDALLELYSVPNPSAELSEAIKQIEAHDFCSPTS